MSCQKFLLILFLPSFAAAQLTDAEYELKARRGIDHIYNLEFESADSMFNALVKIRPRDPAGHFFLAMVDWWRIMTDMEDTQYDERFLDSLDRVIELCDELLEQDENNVMALFFKGGALGFTGRLNFHRDDWLAAANAGREALPLVTTAAQSDPGNYDIYLGTGIYNYYAEAIPDRYPMAKPLLIFIPPGDKAAGITQLQMAAERGTYAHVEAKYFLMQLFYQFESDLARALTLAQELSRRYPDNMLFHRYVGRCYVSMGNFHEASRLFGEVSRYAKQGKRGSPASSFLLA